MTRLERDLAIVESSRCSSASGYDANCRSPPRRRPREGGERYDQFVTALGRRLAKGPKLRQEIARI
jgi:hypothetical protein